MDCKDEVNEIKQLLFFRDSIGIFYCLGKQNGAGFRKLTRWTHYGLALWMAL